MKMNEISDMTEAELAVKERELRQALFNLRMKSRVGQIEKPSLIRALKRDIARILTVGSARPRQEMVQPKTAVKAKA